MKQIMTKRNVVSAAIGITCGLFLALYGANHRSNSDYYVPYEKITGVEVDIEDFGKQMETDHVEVEEETTVTVKEKAKKKQKKVYTDEDLYYLSRVMMGEAGADYCSDEMVWLVGCVVTNRVNSSEFPNSIKDVVLQEGQYASTWIDEFYSREVSDRCLKMAKKLLTKGSDIPSNVVFQAEFLQGDGLYIQVQNMYFCYIEEKDGD